MIQKITVPQFAVLTLIAGALFSSCLQSRAEDSISLSGNDWRLREDAAAQGVAQQYFNADPTGTEWFPAQVPGNVQSDVEAAHLISPLWYGPANTNVYEIARKDWWYRKDFLVPTSYTGRRMTIDFDGVDERCKVWLNGKLIGENAGMFRRFWFDVSAVALPGQTNHLAVQINRMPEELVPMLIASDDPDTSGGPDNPNWFVYGINKTRQILKDLKTPGVWSYDWSANLWTLGIWKDVRLKASGPARIDWTRVETTLDNDSIQPITPITPEGAGMATISHGSNTFSEATVHVTLEVNSSTNGSMLASFQIHGPNADVTKKITVTLTNGLNLVKANLRLDRPALWWPNGQGEQPLYTLSAALGSVDGSSLEDKSSTRFGVRQVKWVHIQTPPNDLYVRSNHYTIEEYQASNYQLLINGRPVRGLGSAITLPDVLPARGSAHELQLLQFAKNCGMNLIRLNGGGGGPLLNDAWYDRADELGIMIAYEYPAGNSIMEDDPVFMANLEATCRNMMKQSRNHPSIIEYLGGNEMGWGRSEFLPALQLMQKIAAQESDRLFRSTDPEPDNKHGPYWFDILQSKDSFGYANGHYGFGELKSRDGYKYYNSSDSDTMWYGEFGTTSPANLEMWYRQIPLKSQWPLDNVSDDPSLIYHNAIKSVGGDSWLFKSRIDALFGPTDNLQDFIEAGQYYGAEGLRYIYDALRRKGNRIGGMTSHDYSEPWPNAAGSYMVDYDGRPLMNYDFLKQALAPISLSLKMDSCLYSPEQGVETEMFLVSDAPKTATGLRSQWVARDEQGKVLGHGEVKADIQPLEVKSLGNIQVHPQSPAGLIFLELRLEDAHDKVLVERVQVFGRADQPHPLAGLLRPDGVKHTHLEVSAAQLANEGEGEVCQLTVKNTGTMTALYCEPHPLLVYRTDIFVDNNHCYIPPGESRKITIRSGRHAGSGLTLAQTGWTISSWNSADTTVAPSKDVVLSVGRWDQMCREYAGYFGTNEVGNAELTGARPDATQLLYRMAGAGKVTFNFDCTSAQARHGTRLRIHTSDQAEEATAVAISVNGQTQQQMLPQGLGIQKTDPAHRAFPATLEFELAGKELHSGKNQLTVTVPNGGWFAWDALDLVSNP